MADSKSPIWMNYTVWRESGRQVRFGPLDGRLSVFIVIIMLFPSKYMLAVLLAVMVFFYYLEYIGYTLPNAFRKIKMEISGKKKNGVHYWRQNKFRY